jgi:hypothetical protein
MPRYAMQLISWADGQPLNCAGEYVKSVDVQLAPITTEWLTTTPNLREAYLWPNARAISDTYYEVLKSEPVRPDGEPNRPLTAVEVKLIKVEKKDLT